MIKIKIKELLKEKDKSMYWLSKKTNISQNAIRRIVSGKTDSIKFRNIDAICTALECRIEEIIEYIPDKY